MEIVITILSVFYGPSLTHKGGQGVNLTGDIDSAYMESIVKL